MVETTHFARTNAPPPVEFVHQTWPSHLGQLQPIRAEVRRWLAPLSLTEDAQVDIVVAVNEAATNAVVHAAAEDHCVELNFWTESTALCIEVIDHGRWQAPASAELTGSWHGIPMMQQHLNSSVLIHYDHRGTRVLLRHPLDATTGSRSPCHAEPRHELASDRVSSNGNMASEP